MIETTEEFRRRTNHSFTRKVNRPEPGTIRLWTIQPLSVWEHLLTEQVLYVDPWSKEFAGNRHPAQLRLYDWMRNQMAKRVQAYTGHYPWWAFCHLIDLRCYRWNYLSPANARLVRIELAIPNKYVLLSRYDAWRWPLGNSYLPSSTATDVWEAEMELWAQRMEWNEVWQNESGSLPEPLETVLLKSWEHVFDVVSNPDETQQAVFECLRYDQVISVTEFTVGNVKQIL